MRKAIKDAYENAKVIISYENGFEFRKNPRRKGNFFRNQRNMDIIREQEEVYGETETGIKMLKQQFIYNHEWQEIAQLLFKDGEGSRSQVEGKNFCISSCRLFENCDKDCDTQECKKRVAIAYKK